MATSHYYLRTPNRVSVSPPSVVTFVVIPCGHSLGIPRGNSVVRPCGHSVVLPWRIFQARRDIAEREEAVQRDRREASSKVQHESGLEREWLDKEVAKLRQEERRLDSLNRELDEKTLQVQSFCPLQRCSGYTHSLR